MLVGQPAVSGGVGGLAAGVLASATTEVGEALDWQPAAASSDKAAMDKSSRLMEATTCFHLARPSNEGQTFRREIGSRGLDRAASHLP